MNNDVKQKWLAALRSGKYKQGTSRLRLKGDAYCCLGVLCDIAAKEGVIPEPVPHRSEIDGRVLSYQYGDEEHGRSNTTLPHSVMEWADLEQNPMVDTSLLKGFTVEDDVEEHPAFEGSQSLAEINDSGLVDFNKIADIIEAEL